MSNFLTTVLLESSTVPGTEQAFNKCFWIMNEVKIIVMQKWERKKTSSGINEYAPNQDPCLGDC